MLAGDTININKPTWYIGEKSAGLVGTIARLHVWDKWVQNHVIRAMARGVNAFDVASSNVMPKPGDYIAFGDHVQRMKGYTLTSVGKLLLKHTFTRLFTYLNKTLANALTPYERHTEVSHCNM